MESRTALFLLVTQDSSFCRPRWGGYAKIRNEHRNNTTCNLKCEVTDTKQRISWWCTDITPVLPNAGQKHPRWGIWNFSRHFRIFIYLFHDVQQGPIFSRNPLWKNLDPSYSTNSQPSVKPDSLRQPGMELYPNPERTQSTPPTLFSKSDLNFILPATPLVREEDIQASCFWQWGSLLCLLFSIHPRFSSQGLIKNFDIIWY